MSLKLFLTVFVLTSAIIVLTSAKQSEQPTPCCFPAQWEATEGILSGSASDEGKTAITMGYIQLSYDASGRRIYGVEMVQTGSMVQHFTFLQLFNESVQYTIVNTTCTRSKLAPWNNENCIPKNASFVSQYTLGLKQSITVNDFSYNMGTVQNVITVINGSCVPVVSQRYGAINGVNLMMSAGIQGATVGIKNETVFDIPKICNPGNVIDDMNVKESFSFARHQEN